MASLVNNVFPFIKVLIDLTIYIFKICTQSRVYDAPVYIISVHYLHFISLWFLYSDLQLKCTVQYGTNWLAVELQTYTVLNVSKTHNFQKFDMLQYAITCDPFFCISHFLGYWCTDGQYLWCFCLIKICWIHFTSLHIFIGGSESRKIRWETEFILSFLSIQKFSRIFCYDFQHLAVYHRVWN